MSPATTPSVRNSTEKIRPALRRVAPSVFRITTSRTRRKRVPATLAARMIAPARIANAGQEADHQRDLIHHLLHDGERFGDVDHGHRRERLIGCALESAHVGGLACARRRRMSPAIRSSAGGLNTNSLAAPTRICSTRCNATMRAVKVLSGSGEL